MTDIDEVARQTAIKLMRLNEALDLADAEQYSSQPNSNGITKREERRLAVDRYYTEWFRNQGET